MNNFDCFGGTSPRLETDSRRRYCGDCGKILYPDQLCCINVNKMLEFSIDFKLNINGLTVNMSADVTTTSKKEAINLARGAAREWLEETILQGFIKPAMRSFEVTNVSEA